MEGFENAVRFGIGKNAFRSENVMMIILSIASFREVFIILPIEVSYVYF